MKLVASTASSGIPISRLRRIVAGLTSVAGHEVVPALELRERILIGMVTATVLFEGSLLALPDGTTFPREAVIDGLIDVARHGASNER